MPTFKAPIYKKRVDPTTSKPEVSYTFPVLFLTEEQGISFIAETKEGISLQALHACMLENGSWWNQFLHDFLMASSRFFSKPYTIDNINRIVKHTLSPNDDETFPAYITLHPNTIQIINGQFVVNWEYIWEPMNIHIPDLEDEPTDKTESSSIPVSTDTVLTMELQELNMDQLPLNKNSTEETLEVDDLKKSYDKQLVREARLKAKLAMYKANHQLTKYYDNYAIDDISESESEEDTSEEDEEVEL